MISATEFIRTMAGGSSSALLKCSDGRFYFAKQWTCNQWQSTRFLVYKLARCVGLPVPEAEVIQVDQWLD